MTPSQRTFLQQYVLPFLIPFIAAFIAIGTAKNQLEGKEDRASHALSVDSVRSDIRLMEVRHEANDQRVLERATDAACAVNPKLRYCK